MANCPGQLFFLLGMRIEQEARVNLLFVYFFGIIMAWLVLFTLFCGHYLPPEFRNQLSPCGSPALFSKLCVSVFRSRSRHSFESEYRGIVMGRSGRGSSQSGRPEGVNVSRQDLELLQTARARYLLEGMVLYDFGSRSAAVFGFEYLVNLHYLPTDDGITREIYLYDNAAWNLLEQLAASQRDGTFKMDLQLP